LPFLGIYQRLVYSYFFFKKLIKSFDPDFFLVTGGSAIIPQSMAERTIVYVHYPTDLEIAQKDYTSNIIKKLYIRPYLFVSNNLDYIKKATIITNSNYTKNAIKQTWNADSTVIYPPCPQYSFPLEDKLKEETADTYTVCSLGRFTPEKEYHTILKIAKERPKLKFELIGSVTPDKISYLEGLKNKASKNVIFHVNASIDEKNEVLKRSKILIHSFKGEHFGVAIIEAMSAGLLPITHNSGAAKEDQLVGDIFRYDTLENALDCLDRAISIWNLDKASKLRQYAQNFSPENYKKNLKSFLVNWITTHLHLLQTKE
jgi:alpha-1,2-mannosyltransferase